MPPAPTSRRVRRSADRLTTTLAAAVDGWPDGRITRLAALRPVRHRLLRELADALDDGRLGPEPVRLRLVLLAGPRRLVYVVTADLSGARVRWGAAEAPLEVELALADAVRIGLGRLDPGQALLDRRLEVRGDVAVALRLTEAFEPD